VDRERGTGDFIEVERAGEDAFCFFFPIFDIAGVLEFDFDGRESLQNELKGIGQSDGVLACDASVIW
jgi:hypothetical protein